MYIITGQKHYCKTLSILGLLFYNKHKIMKLIAFFTKLNIHLNLKSNQTIRIIIDLTKAINTLAHNVIIQKKSRNIVMLIAQNNKDLSMKGNYEQVFIGYIYYTMCRNMAISFYF